jgi:hypothetical protein
MLEVTMTFADPLPECKPDIGKRECPPIILERKNMGAVAKVMSMLKSWYLMRGPSERRLQLCCSKVVNFPTDFGAESQVALARNVMPAFMGRPIGSADVGRMFPRAMRTIGWSHNWDNCAKFLATNVIPWYPEWVVTFKLVVRFCRIKTYTDVIKQSLRDKHLAGMTTWMTRVPPNFAKWRWGTLVRSAIRLMAWKLCLCIGFDESLFDTSGEIVAAAKLVTTEGNELFWARTQYIVCVCSPPEFARSWGVGCSCHEEARLAGRIVDCLCRRANAWCLGEGAKYAGNIGANIL